MGQNCALVTGSCGLIGAQAVEFFIEKGFKVKGLDNDQRAYFFGPEASTSVIQTSLEDRFKDKYQHYTVDIRNKQDLELIFKKNDFQVVIHTAAQPSHDWAAKEPMTDFSVNVFNLIPSFVE